MFPNRSREMLFHSGRARELSAAGRHDEARASYLKWVESARQLNVTANGAFEAGLREAQREYSEFAKTDPLNRAVCDALIPIVRDNPGLLQTDIYKKLVQFNRAQLSYAIYFAAEHGMIARVKRGRTYSLNLPGMH